MKTILIDAVYCYVSPDGVVNAALEAVLARWPNPKVVLTSADEQQFQQFGLGALTYPVFSLQHNPEKSDPAYFQALLAQYHVEPDDVVYIEHDPAAAASARSQGIRTHWYDTKRADTAAVEAFLVEALT